MVIPFKFLSNELIEVESSVESSGNGGEDGETSVDPYIKLYASGQEDICPLCDNEMQGASTMPHLRKNTSVVGGLFKV